MKRTEEIDAILVVENPGDPMERRGKIWSFRANESGSKQALNLFRNCVLQNIYPDCGMTFEEAMKNCWFEDTEGDYIVYIVRSEKNR